MSRAKMVSWLAAAVGTALLAASGNVAAADPQESTHVDSLVAAAFGNTVAVTGEAGFVDVPALVGEDPPGDSTWSDFDVPMGDDLTTATIARPDPLKDTLTFSVGVSNPPPTLNGTPEVIMYIWEFSVTSPDGESADFQLRAQRSGQGFSPGSAKPYFVIAKCVDGELTGRTCETLDQPLTGTMADNVVAWNVPMDRISAQTGSVVGAGTIQVSASAAGRLWFGGGAAIFDSAFTEHDYVVPGPTVNVGIAPVGTPPEFVETTHEATVKSNGSFDATFPAPTSPGEYVVVAKACNGEGNCGLASASMTI